MVRRFRYIDGEVVEVTERSPAASSQQGPALGAYSESRPLVSVGCGCHSTQVQEYNAAVAASGIVGVHYRPDGKAEFTSRGARRRWLHHRGMKDNDGGYGDG